MLTHTDRLLPMEGARNLRCLGGFSTRSGHQTVCGVFYRGDSTDALTPGDLTLLENRHVRTVIDLRADSERAARPSVLANRPPIRYEQVPLFDGFLLPTTPKTMGEVYVRLLEESPDGFARICRLALETQDGACLFHCTSGKDRTGVTAMLLLEFAGVEDTDILEDYRLTEVYARQRLDRMIALQRERGLEERVHMFTAQPAQLAQALAYLRQKWGGAAGYLQAAGLTQGELEALRARFVV